MSRLHMIKLAPGVRHLDQLHRWAEVTARRAAARGLPELAMFETRNTPKRRDELLDGGSLYFVVQGLIQVRAVLKHISTETGADGRSVCLVGLDPVLVPVHQAPRRPFRGWRYMDAAEAPADLGQGRGSHDTLPPELEQELARLGVM